MEIIECPSDLTPLRASWERLAADAGSFPMDDYAWAVASAHTLAQDGLHVVVVGDAGEPRAVAPLVRRRGQLKLLGTAELYEPADLLAASPGDLDELVDGLTRLRMPILLGCLPSDSPTLNVLRAGFGGRMIIRNRQAAYSIPLGEPWTETGGGLNPRRRADLRRAMRRAEAEGAVTVDLLRPAADEVPVLLDAAFAVEDRSWKALAGTSLARDARRGAFFRRYAEEVAKRGQLRLDFLRIGDKTAAMQIAVEWHQRIWLLKIGYDEAFARMSPGMLLLAHAIANAARNELASYELLGETKGWARAWTDEFTPMVVVAAYPFHLRGAVAFARDGARYSRSDEGRAMIRRATKKPAHTVRKLIARRYMAGSELQDALELDTAYRSRGMTTTVGFFDGPDDDPRSVMAQYVALANVLGDRADSELSVKVPSVKYDRAGIAGLLERPVRVHFDALAAETQSAVLDLAVELAPGAGGRLGCTLAGRWARSVEDAVRVAEHGLRVRVVKGQWTSPEEPDRDFRQGYLAVVEALVEGNACFVAVATHDGPLAKRALDTLAGAGIPAELQLLHGRHAHSASAAANEAGVPIRYYVPYGYFWLPFSVRDALRDPATARRLARDLLQRNRPI